MDFDEKVKEIGNDILNTVIKVIEENKGDDDKYYASAYLKLQDGSRIWTSFTDYTKRIEQRSFKWNKEYQKRDGYLFHIDKESAFGFLVDVNLYFLNREDIIYSACDKEHESEEPNEEDKKIIINFLNDLYKKFLTIEYDKETTHEVANYNSEEMFKYNIQKYNEAMKKLSESNPDSTVLPSVEVAVNWWIDAITSNDRVKSTGEELFDAFYAQELTIARNENKVDDNQIEIFRNTLTSIIMEKLSKGEDVYLSISHKNLISAMKAAKIHALRFPYRAAMRVTTDKVLVDNGQDGKYVEIYNSEEERLVR